MKKANYAIVGRIPGDDEDSVLTYENVTHKQALRSFEQDMYYGCSRAHKARVRRVYDSAVYITHVLVSAAPIKTT
jgi:hypothetical protein